MKKLRILVLLIILTFSFSSKAEVLLEIDCNGNEISSSNNITCELGLYYEKEGITDIKLDINTNLDINYLNIDGFNVINEDNNLLIHSDTILYDEIMNYTKILEFTLSLKESNNIKENLVINNIIINNDIKVDDINKEFVIKKEPIKLDNICTLNSISVENELVKDFNKDKFEYSNIFVKNEYIFIDAVRTSNKSMATGLGTKKVGKGETKEIDITVTAEDGTQNIYKLFITNITPKEIKSDDNYLKSLEIYQNNNKLDLVFDKNKTIYNIDVDNKEILNIKAKLNNTKASFVKDYGPRDINIDNNSLVLIKIRAENGDERVITIKVNYIEKTKVSDEIITPDISFNNISLPRINKLIKINNSNLIINIISCIIFGIGLVCLTMSTIYAIRRK